MSKKIILGLALACAVVLPIAVLAQAGPPQVGSLQEIIDKILSAVWIVFTAIAVIALVVAGVLFLTAAGNPEKIAAARSALVWGVAGVVVGIVAYSIIAIVASIIG